MISTCETSIIIRGIQSYTRSFVLSSFDEINARALRPHLCSYLSNFFGVLRPAEQDTIRFTHDCLTWHPRECAMSCLAFVHCREHEGCAHSAECAIMAASSVLCWKEYGNSNGYGSPKTRVRRTGERREATIRDGRRGRRMRNEGAAFILIPRYANEH